MISELRYALNDYFENESVVLQLIKTLAAERCLYTYVKTDQLVFRT